MRTRTASIVEASVIWFLVVTSFVAAGAIWYLLTADYNERRRIQEEKNEEIRQKVDSLQREIDGLERKIKDLKRKVQQKEKEDAAQKEELNRKIASLQKTIIYLPPYDYWPDLIKQVEIIAEKLQVYIGNFQMVEQNDLESKNTQDTFTENIFLLDLEGDYSRIMEYLWTLENAIYLTGRGGTTRWRAVVKVVNGGFNIQQLNTEDETMKLRLTLMTFFRKGVTGATANPGK